MDQSHIASADVVMSPARGKRNQTSGSRSKAKAQPKQTRRYARNERTTKGTYTSRRYGPDNADVQDTPTETIGIMSAYTDFSKMDNKQLAQYAVMHWNHHFPEGENRENMMNEIQRRMDTRRHARYA